MFRPVLALAVVCPLAALAFNPPHDRAGDLQLGFVGFDEDVSTRELRVRTVPAGEPLPFTVVLENGGGSSVTGKLRFGVNDDWTLEGRAEEQVTVPAGGKLEFARTARAKPGVVSGLYPLHATFTARGVDLHPIAIFRAETGREPARMDGSVLGETPGWERVFHDDGYWAALGARACELAAGALKGGAAPERGVFLLADGDSRFGAALVPGENGIFDAALAFSDGRRSVFLRGFHCRVDGRDLGLGARMTVRAATGGAEYLHELQGGLSFRVTARAEGGALRMKWDMPGVKRAANGSPRFTHLKVEFVSERVRRLYAGFGNVIAEPRRILLQPNGFQCCTRHVGMDFPNGLSLVQAVDVPPDWYECDAGRNRSTLVAHNDAEFTFVPSNRGSFDAAIRFAAVSGYRRSPGWAAIAGCTGVDTWEPDCERKAAAVAALGRYGFAGSVLVKHNWQRWGYDYRLPDIYPPSMGLESLRTLREACRAAKIRFCPHDNYTDIYPDCDGFSYDFAVFDPDGRPQLAWYHDARHAQSYRWAAHAFRPFLERNARLMKGGFDPDGLFIDVLTAHPPYDYHERNGAFHPRGFTARKWGEAFDAVRACWGRKDATMVSEAGTDFLIGHVDAAEADHFAAASWAKPDQFADSERVPWHDAVSHGRMVLFAGGLGGRYSGGDRGHGYGSDDYLSNTVIGGRNPLAEAEFSRDTVATHWLLGGVSRALAQERFAGFEFAGDDIHRLHSRFSGGGEVRVNRGDSPWEAAGETLPRYGFVATAGQCRAAVVERNGRRIAYAREPGGWFVDARGPVNRATSSGCPVTTDAVGFAAERPDVFAVETQWTVREPVGDQRPFVHVVPENGGETPILLQSIPEIPSGALARRGTFSASVRFRLPPGLGPGRYDIRYGLYNGPRMKLDTRAGMDGCMRVRGGTLVVEKDGDRFVRTEWISAVRAPVKAAEPVDFGPIATDGAFRLDCRGKTWSLRPLPGSYPFLAKLDLSALGARGRVSRVEFSRVAEPSSFAAVEWRMSGRILELPVDGEPGVYRIVF